jgi:hypothetical protein
VRSVNLFTTKEKKMKKKLFALSGVFLIVLVIAGLWAAKAINLNGVEETIPQSTPMSLASGLSVEQMAQDASAIVIGQCTGTQSRWVERRLVTDATILVGETLKGDATPGSVMKVELPGGISPNGRFQVAMTYAGAPQISPEEEVFLFLYRPVEDASSYSVMGFAQGKFSINKADDGEKVVMRDMTRAQVQKGAGAIRGNFQVVPLSEFKAFVMSILNK